MKKILAVCAAAALCANVAVPAFAVTITEASGTAQTDVKASYVDVPVEKVYSVDIEWGDLTFSYTEEGLSDWSAETHDYAVKQGAKWEFDDGANKITIANHSNAAGNASLVFAAADGYSDVVGTFNETVLKLDTAVGTAVEKPPTSSASLTLSGSMPALDENASGLVVGTVTVSLSLDE